MVPSSRAQRHIRGLAPFLICLTLFALLPSTPSSAGGMVADPIGNTQGSYSGGQFQRTVISKDKTDIQPNATLRQPADEDGAVQLTPIGKLAEWKPLALGLKTAVSQPGVTALNGRLYVISGLTGGVRTAAANWATVDLTTGSLVGDTIADAWQTNTLPDDDLLPYTNVRSQTNAGRSLAGVVSVAKDASSGYIYVVGGDIGTTLNETISTPVVQRATVGSNGTPSWTTLANHVPVPENSFGDANQPVGLAGAATVIARASDGRYFLYVIGGRSIYVEEDGDIDEYVLKSVYHAEIDINTGDLKYPGPGTNPNPIGGVWKSTGNIPLLDIVSGEGLWKATASVAEMKVNNQTKSYIFLAGGTHNLGQTHINPYVYRAEIGTNGDLTWSSQPGPSNSQVLIQARMGMASLTYNNKLYLIGGQTGTTGGTAKDSVLNAIFDNSSNFIYIPGSTDVFIGKDDKVLGGLRRDLGAALIEAEPPAGSSSTSIDLAWAYAVGGFDSADLDTATIFLGKIGANEIDPAQVVRAPDGWYYSEVFQTSIEDAGDLKKARVVAIHWATEIDRSVATGNPSADIQIEFRKTVTSTGECKADGSDFTSAESDRWRGPIDADSDNSLFFSKNAVAGALYNSVTMKTIFPSEEINASCLQYRAHFMQDVGNGNPLHRSISPKLLSVYIEKVIAGNADVNIPSGGFDVVTTNNRLSSLKMSIQNLNIADPGTTVSVPDAVLSELQNPPPFGEGSFYVDLCIARTDLGAAPPTLTLPDPAANFYEVNGTTCPYYATIQNAEMAAGTVLNLITSTRWYRNSDDTAVSDIRSAFSQLGQYKVGIVLDSTTAIPESQLGETNNKSEIDSFTIEGEPIEVEDPNVILLPLIWR